jgi:hypothetical protein
MVLEVAPTCREGCKFSKKARSCCATYNSPENRLSPLIAGLPYIKRTVIPGNSIFLV